MTDHDDLFDDVAATDSAFADKGALDPLADPDTLVFIAARVRRRHCLGSDVAFAHRVLDDVLEFGESSPLDLRVVANSVTNTPASGR